MRPPPRRPTLDAAFRPPPAGAANAIMRPAGNVFPFFSAHFPKRCALFYMASDRMGLLHSSFSARPAGITCVSYCRRRGKKLYCIRGWNMPAVWWTQNRVLLKTDDKYTAHKKKEMKKRMG